MSEPDMAMVDTVPRSTFSRFTPLGRRNSETGSSVGNSPTLTAPLPHAHYSDIAATAATPRFTLESLAAELELLSTSPTGGFNYLSGELYKASRAPLTKSRSVPNVLTDLNHAAAALVPLRKAKSVRFADSQGLPLIEAVYELSKQDSSYTANKIVPYSDDLSAGVQLTTGRRAKNFVAAPSTVTPCLTRISQLTINTTNILQVTQSSPVLATFPLSPPTAQHRHRLGFTQPSLEPDFFHRVNKHCVVLDNVREEARSLQGTVRVANLSYEKEVVIRWTHDNWRSSHDTKAVFCANDGASDRFTFELPINGDDVIFCIRFKTNDQEYWDNNHGSNYIVFSE